MRRYLPSLISALLLAIPMMAEEVVPPQPPTPPQPPGALQPSVMPPGSMPPGSMLPGNMKPELMKEMREIEGQWRAMKEKTDQDPEVLKLKNAADEAQKAYKSKAEEVMVKNPDYLALKARRDDMRIKLGGHGKKKDKGDDKPPHDANAAPVPAP